MAIMIRMTKEYRMFVINNDNREMDLKKHHNLRKSMMEYGFLRSFPLSCKKTDKGNWMVKDGQHRLQIAEDLGLPVYWVEEVVDYDVAKVNSTPKVWVFEDYVRTQANNGSADCMEVVDFVGRHKIGFGLAAALLSGQTGISVAQKRVMAGEFKVVDVAYAELVISTYKPIAMMSKRVRNARFLQACMACCRVVGFDPKRLVKAADRQRNKLISYGDREAYLGMMEEIYNDHHKKPVSLKFPAMAAIRERNPVKRGKVEAAD